MGSVVRFMPAEYREISRVSVWPGVVCPDTVEYAYESSRAFGNYGALPGEEVHAGDVLFYGAAESVSDEIEAIEEENAALLEEYAAASADLAADIAKAVKEEYEAALAFQELYNKAPAEDSPGYAGWAKGAMPAEKRAKQTKLAREKLEQSLKEKREQFDLQYAYNEKRVERLQTELAEAGVAASSDGVVVASSYYLPGDQVPEGSHILAVGDPDNKEILCDYVSKAAVNRAAEIYAMIGGQRFEVQYEVMEPDEYRRIKQRDGEVFTSFHLADPSGEVAPGQSAVVVIVEERKTNVLSVPRDAVNRDERGAYVFLYKDGETVYTPVRTGVYDATFIEITGGLQEGDPVVYDVPYSVGNKTLRLEKGEMSTDLSTDGFLFYPSAEWLVNPAKTGTCYLKELLVKRYELVEKGQVLATIEIMGDDIEAARIRRKIDRQNERLADLQKKRGKTYNKDELDAIDRAVRDRNRSIESLQKQLEKLTRYTGVYEVTAPENGIVTAITERKAGELIDYRERLVQLSRDDSSYIIVEDENGRLSCGDEAGITVRSLSAPEEAVAGRVVTISPRGLSKEMRSGYALIKIPQEDMGIIADEAGASMDNGYWSRKRFGVEITTGRTGEVLLIPRKAVYTTDNGDTFVITKREDGTTRLVRFTAGGSDPSNYWVAYGDVEEGMEICSE
ncbi:MAG: efflux RND transporter periplasmic adaptor subunit [Lachnospiraceae bacterium]|nr:efflux RND transporter periplasmic adaptor subunit [Lachnospiraceae bacterium]